VAMLVALLLAMTFIVLNYRRTISILAGREHLAEYCYTIVEAYSMVSEVL